MSEFEGQVEGKVMPFGVRPLQKQDVAQSTEIERESFSNLFSYTPLRHESKNKSSSYLVAWRRDDLIQTSNYISRDPDLPHESNSSPFVDRLLRGIKACWSRRPTTWQPGQSFIAGFLGILYMVDEAHIVSLGVRNNYRGQGIGELLLMGAIEEAMARRAKVITLEVRTSNHVAKNLYLKYGFTERGLRKGYYSDNQEDAIIMTTEPILEPPYPLIFHELIKSHEQRWGKTKRPFSQSMYKPFSP